MYQASVIPLIWGDDGNTVCSKEKANSYLLIPNQCNYIAAAESHKCHEAILANQEAYQVWVNEEVSQHLEASLDSPTGQIGFCVEGEIPNNTKVITSI